MIATLPDAAFQVFVWALKTFYVFPSLLPQTHLPNIKVHAYFAPVTPPPSVGGSRQRFCRCCVLLWCKDNSPLPCLPVSLVHASRSLSLDPWSAVLLMGPLSEYMLVCLHLLNSREKERAKQRYRVLGNFPQNIPESPQHLQTHTTCLLHT